jgi:hypothetical protein
VAWNITKHLLYSSVSLSLSLCLLSICLSVCLSLSLSEGGCLLLSAYVEDFSDLGIDANDIIINQELAWLWLRPLLFCFKLCSLLHPFFLPAGPYHPTSFLVFPVSSSFCIQSLIFLTSYTSFDICFRNILFFSY